VPVDEGPELHRVAQLDSTSLEASGNAPSVPSTPMATCPAWGNAPEKAASHSSVGTDGEKRTKLPQ